MRSRTRLPGPAPLWLLGLFSLLPVLFPAAFRKAAAANPAEPETALHQDGYAGKEVGEPAGTLHRTMEPVLLEGEWLEEAVGAPLSALRLYRFRNGTYEAIRFQVDEKTVAGDWVFPHGKKNNGSEGNGLLDGRDVLLFMAKDAGQRAYAGAPPAGAGSVTEIEIADPVNAARAWVYLAVWKGEPPPLCPLPDYVRYVYETEEVFTASSYSKFIITREGLHTSFSEMDAILPAAGGDGRNRLDRMKTRITIRFFFNLIPMRIHEEMLGQDVVAYITGPVRVIRRLEQFFKLPFGLRGLKSFTDLHLYESLTIVPADVHVPRGVDKVISSVHIWFGADLSPDAIGSFFRNSENLEPLLVDGRMSESEERFNTKQDQWRVLYGRGGAMLTRVLFPPEYSRIMKIRQRYVDDVTVADPPERYPGSIGVLKTEMVSRNLKGGRYNILVEVYIPPDYRVGDEQECLNVRDHPVQVRIRGKTHTNRLYPGG